MIRCLDMILSLMGLILLSPLFLLILLIGYFENGSPIFVQTRLGRREQLFTLMKFRTMKSDTGSHATHLVDPSCVTRFGKFLRVSKLDELPQLINVLKGEMSLVGPRPCLTNQAQLIETRRQLGVFNVAPGITGLAQVNKIDMSRPIELAAQDAKMISTFNIYQYFKYIVLTLLGKGSGDRTRTSKLAS